MFEICNSVFNIFKGTDIANALQNYFETLPENRCHSYVKKVETINDLDLHTNEKSFFY